MLHILPHRGAFICSRYLQQISRCDKVSRLCSSCSTNMTKICGVKAVTVYRVLYPVTAKCGIQRMGSLQKSQQSNVVPQEVCLSVKTFISHFTKEELSIVFKQFSFLLSQLIKTIQSSAFENLQQERVSGNYGLSLDTAAVTAMTSKAFLNSSRH